MSQATGMANDRAQHIQPFRPTAGHWDGSAAETGGNLCSHTPEHQGWAHFCVLALLVQKKMMMILVFLSFEH